MRDWKDRLLALKDVASADLPDWFVKAATNAHTTRDNQKRVVALSGGKDSTAMALALAFFEPNNYEYAITPTGNELPVMIAHWRKLADLLDAPLLPVGRASLKGEIKRQRRLPNHRQRWCTRIIKLEQFYGWLGAQTPCTSYVGLRADEESRPGMIFPNADGVQMDFPMHRWGWTIDDVRAFLAFLEVEIPERTDCAWCFWQKLGEWYELWRDYPDIYAEGMELEEWVSAEQGATFTWRSPSRDKWPASLRELRACFEAGEIPERSLKIMDKHRQIGACRVCTL